MRIGSTILVISALLVGTATIVSAYPGQQLAGRAKVSIGQARSIALHAVRGTIVSEELERETGGSGLRYTFDIKTAAGIREIGVDTATGAVIENSRDTIDAPTTKKRKPSGTHRPQ